MGKKNNYSSMKWVVIVGIFLCMVTGFTLYRLIPIPFGFHFTATLYLFSASIVFVLSVTALICFRAARRWLTLVGLIPLLLAVVVALLTIIVNTDYRTLYFRSLSPKPTRAEWIEDLHYLAEQMVEKHEDLYSLVSKDKLDQTILEIEKRIPELSDSEIQMELFRLAALPNDAHTFPFIMFPCFDLYSFPFKVFGFPEGWTIVDAGRGYKNLIGARILKIGSVKIEDIYEKYPIFLAIENESAKKERFTYMIVMADWLAYHDIIDDIGRADFTLEKKDGEEVVVSVPSVKFFPHFLWSGAFSIDNDAPPVFTNYRKDWYRFKLLERTGTLYIQLNQCQNQPGRETTEMFTLRLDNYVRNHEFQRCVIDIRNNDGGDSGVYARLIQLLRENEKINQYGKLFVLMGRRTFSAAAMLAAQFQLQTKALFVGEATGQGTVFFGGPSLLELPNSRMVFAVSTRQTVAGLPFDGRKTITPDIPVPFTRKDFIEGRDPVLERAENYHPPEIKTVFLPVNVLERYTGRYLLSPVKVMDVRRHGSSLRILLSDFIPGSEFRFRSDLYPESGNRFTTDVPNVTIRFSAVPATRPNRLILSWMGQEKVLKRAPADYTLAMESFSLDAIVKGCEMIRRQKEFHREHYPDLESKLNRMGYDYLRSDDVKVALTIFSLNVDLFPESYNVYDSYAEACMESGEPDLAVINYKKSLELNPDNTNAVEMLKRINGKK